jgi:hypothetical protein
LLGSGKRTSGGVLNSVAAETLTSLWDATQNAAATIVERKHARISICFPRFRGTEFSHVDSLELQLSRFHTDDIRLT